MFAEMRPKEEDSLLGGGDTEMFMDFFDQAMAKDFVDQGNPLVDLIVGRLTPREAGKTETGKGEAGPS
jgi:Rod binding domain-containing protein